MTTPEPPVTDVQGPAKLPGNSDGHWHEGVEYVEVPMDDLRAALAAQPSEGEEVR